MTEIYRASLLSPSSGDSFLQYEDAYLAVEDGEIAGVGPWEEASDGPEPVDLRPLTMVPGFVDAHLHLVQFPIRGLYGRPLLEWLHQYTFPFESKFADPKFAEEELDRSFRSLLANGVTTIAAYVSSHPHAAEIAFEKADSCGIRAVIGLTLMDRNAPPEICQGKEVWLPAAKRLIQDWDGKRGRLHFAVTPRFALSCTEDLMRAAGDLARDRGTFVQTHLSEQMPEVEAIMRDFPSARDTTSLLDSFGLLGERTLLAHCIELSDSEIELIADRGARPIHCPTSNRVLGSGRMPLEKMKTSGITVGLGSDVGAGPEWNPFLVTREAALLQSLPLGEAWSLATKGGAGALGLNVGRLEVGCRADFLVLAPIQDSISWGQAASRETDGGRAPVPGWVTAGFEERLSQWIFGGGPEQIHRVYVEGRLVHEK